MKNCLFPEIDGKSIKVLILGSFPGEESLKREEYYAYKYNQFWDIIFEVIGKKLPTGYRDRIRGLNSSGIGLWDVIRTCDRNGSADQDIREPRMNDLERLNGFSELKGIFFNGRTAEKLFNRHYTVSDLMVGCLPSTSPLNTQKKKEKVKSWQKIKTLLA